MSEERSINQGNSVELPDELWANLLAALPGAIRGIETSIRLFSGEVVERLIISNRGRVIGRIAEGLAGAHGDIDSSVLKFNSDDIEAVLAPSFRFWKKTEWIALQPENPAWDKWRKRTNRVQVDKSVIS